MNKLAQLTIPGYRIDPFPNLKPGLAGSNLGSIISSLLELVFMITGILMFIWALVGIFQYITAGGNKEGLAKARARLTWAIIGFIFVVAAFSISLYVQQLIQPKTVQFCSDQQAADCANGNPPRTCVIVNDKPNCQ